LEHLIRITKNVAVEEYDPEKNLETWFSREENIELSISKLTYRRRH
jgi:hypothetical protein